MHTNKKTHTILVIGDVIALLLVTLAGFQTHSALGTAGARILTTLLPLLAGWLLIGIPLRIFAPETITNPRQLWRAPWAMILAAPLFAFLRALMLSATSILPVFIMIIGGISAVALLTWRVLLTLIITKTKWMTTN